MPVVEDLQVGVMFWAGPDPHQTLRDQKALGVRAGQLGIEGDYPLDGAAEKWKRAVADEQFTVVTVFAAYTGESYADMPTVQRTVGFIPPATRQERERRTYEISDFARGIGVGSIALHVGFVPHDPKNDDYIAVRNLVRRIADHAAENGQTFALETGQEPADVLDKFIRDVDRPNLKINFDPANMIMYGTGDPIQALDVLSRNIVSVHCKDGEWPDKSVPNALGVEKPLGQGAVGMDKFIAKLKQFGYKGILGIEREILDKEQKKRDMKMAVELLERLRKQ
ncbi:MAG TPA: sugar phosphate isomerase/epimerase family protein [Bryobacteraceae bacterium]|nr:sugar phosphate isomerase/epimerase family protein [Bryobacteraceae bacterium]